MKPPENTTSIQKNSNSTSSHSTSSKSNDADISSSVSATVLTGKHMMTLLLIPLAALHFCAGLGFVTLS
jgi:hypothetical protein